MLLGEDGHSFVQCLKLSLKMGARLCQMLLFMNWIVHETRYYCIYVFFPSRLPNDWLKSTHISESTPSYSLLTQMLISSRHLQRHPKMIFFFYQLCSQLLTQTNWYIWWTITVCDCTLQIAEFCTNLLWTCCSLRKWSQIKMLLGKEWSCLSEQEISKNFLQDFCREHSSNVCIFYQVNIRHFLFQATCSSVEDTIPIV